MNFPSLKSDPLAIGSSLDHLTVRLEEVCFDRLPKQVSCHVGKCISTLVEVLTQHRLQCCSGFAWLVCSSSYSKSTTNHSNGSTHRSRYIWCRFAYKSRHSEDTRCRSKSTRSSSIRVDFRILDTKVCLELVKSKQIQKDVAVKRCVQSFEETALWKRPT